jgi:23S rRNA pseudouridine1911/1915/1917 synthase
MTSFIFLFIHMNNKRKITVKKLDKPMRLDVFLSEKLEASRAQVQKLIKTDCVIVNEKLPKKAGDLVRNEHVIVIKRKNKTEKKKISINPEEVSSIVKKRLSVKIIADEKNYLIINKPSGMLVHPTQANEKHTLTQWILKKYPEIKHVGEESLRPGIVHRLDKEASGLLVIAKTQKMYLHLKKQFKQRTIEKEYGVLVYGTIKKTHATIDFAIGRGEKGKMVSRPHVDRLSLRKIRNVREGKESLTEFWIEKNLVNFTHLRIRIHSGRTHQIRVHMQAYSHPIVGDNLYYNKKNKNKRGSDLGRLFLHAQKLCFNDLEEKRVCFKSKLPKKLNDFLKTYK